MKKKEKIISIPERKAYIVGCIMSFIFAVIVSFGITTLFKEIDVIKEQITLNFTGLLIFPLFIVFVMFILGFITFCKTTKK